MLLRIILSVFLLSLLLLPGESPAASIVASTPSATGVVTLTANDLSDVAGIDVTIYYDQTTLSVPTVAIGSLAASVGAFMLPNTDNAGVVRIAWIVTTEKTMNGSGDLATITFKKSGNLPGKLLNFTSSVYSGSTSSQVSAQSIISDSQTITPTPTAPTTTATTASTTTDSSHTTASTTTDSSHTTPSTTTTPAPVTQPSPAVISSVPGTITYDQQPAQQEVKKEEPPHKENHPKTEETPAPVAEAQAVPSEPPMSAPEPLKPQVTVDYLANLKGLQSPLSRFRSYQGERTVKTLSRLFDPDPQKKAVLVQTPAIAVSDGTTPVLLKIELKSLETSPNFSLSGAKLRSFKKVSDKMWELDLLPQKGRYTATVTVMVGNDLAEIPVVVVPTLADAVVTRTQGLSDAGVDSLLKQGKQAGAVVYDLNSDGKQDYIDDYILVAQWILKNRKGSTPGKSKP